jgi:hypothetical protein
MSTAVSLHRGKLSGLDIAGNIPAKALGGDPGSRHHYYDDPPHQGRLTVIMIFSPCCNTPHGMLVPARALVVDTRYRRYPQSAERCHSHEVLFVLNGVRAWAVLSPCVCWVANTSARQTRPHWSLTAVQIEVH